MSSIISKYSPARPEGVTFAYGTAGFRMKADILDSTVFRAGLLASLRSQFLKGQVIGVMITASHNPPADNGVKLVDPQGEMLESAWEPCATELSNLGTDDEIEAWIQKFVTDRGIDTSVTPQVIYGRDSRDSGPRLVKCLEGALEYSQAKSTDYGLLTTPQLHYLVRCLNTLKTPNSYGVPTEEGYHKKLSIAYKKLLSSAQTTEPYRITIDTANGVGGPKVRELAKLLEGFVDINVVNDAYNEPQKLNSDCGADFVKTMQKCPTGVDPEVGKLYASFDGDADRIVFFYVDQSNQFRLLDGDKIASLAASYIGELVHQTGTQLRMGVVQTAYANGSSTEYLVNSLKLPVECTPTGVKHLHHAAQKFDIGVYFEANGHGTVLFDPVAISTLQGFQVTSPAQKSAIDSLLALSDLINQTVGDSMSDLLLVLAVLTLKKWTPSDWDECYTDLPNRLAKVKVSDRSIFKTTDAERKLTAPSDLQPKIDDLVKKYNQGRSFVRASGTENVVRVYAEASTKSEAEDLAYKVSQLASVY